MKHYFVFLFLFLIISKSTSQDIVQTTFKTDSITVEKTQYYLKKLQLEYANGAYKAHKKYSDSLYTIAKKNGLIKQQVLAMVNQAVYYNNKSEQNKSIKLYREALNLCKNIPEDYRSKIIVLVNLGNVYNNIEAYKKGVHTMKEVLYNLNHIEDNQKIKAAAHIGLSNNYEGLKNYDSTLVHLFKAKEIAIASKNEIVLTTALSNLSDTYYHLGDYKKAKQTGEEALQLSIISKPGKKRAWLLLTLGISESKLDNQAKAIEYLTESQQIAVTHQLTEVEMFSYKHLAEIYETNKDLTKASLFNEKYLLLNNAFLENQKKATKLDLEKDLEAKDAIIIDNEKALSKSLNTKAQLIFWIAIIVLLLLIISFFAIRKKRQQATESELLKKQLAILKETSISETIKQTIPEKQVQYKNSSLTPEDYTKYKEQLLVLMNTKKLYIDYNLSQTDLASQLKISSNHLSEVLRFAFDQNFYNFINSYKVIEAQKLMQADSHKEAKLLAIAFDSGFKSKTSFNRIFKNHTSMTPSEYRKNPTN